jgi:hypothetical protein
MKLIDDLIFQDMHTIDLEPYQYGGTNITGIRLVDPSDPDVRTAAREIADLSHNLTLTADNLRVSLKINVSIVLIYLKY